MDTDVIFDKLFVKTAYTKPLNLLVWRPLKYTMVLDAIS